MLQYYTAKEVAKLLNISVQTVYRKAKSGELPSEGKRPNIRFPKEAVDTITEIGEEEQPKALQFLPSTNADLWEGLQVTHQLYGDEDSVPYKRLLEWQRANDEIFMSLKDGNELVGAITFMPIDEQTAIALVNNQIKEKDVPASSLKKWSERKLSVYIPTIEVIPSGSERRDKERASFLLRRTIKWAIMLTIQHDIKNWYAIGATSEGQAVLEALGFQEIKSFENGRRKGYILDMNIEPVKLVNRIIKDMGGREGLLLLTEKEPGQLITEREKREEAKNAE
jgi:excisionase family DNA binding protein